MSGDFLATIHSGLLGVYLWANRTLYVHVNLKPIELNEKNIPKIGIHNQINNTFYNLLFDY